MNIKTLFENVISVDKQILKIYQNIIINEYLQKDNEKNIEYLKELIELEKWAYSKIDLSYLKLNFVLEELEKCMIPEIELSNTILFTKIKSDNILENSLEEKYITQLIFYRIYLHLEEIYYLNPQTPKKINCYNESSRIIDKKDDKTDIYLTDASYVAFRNETEQQYIKNALENHTVVLTFNTELKKQLELEAMVDMEQLAIMLLKIKTSIDVNNRYFYIQEIYFNMFKNKRLEERVIKADFYFDDLFDQFSTCKFHNQNNIKFLKIHREQISYISIYEYIKYLFSFVDNDFTQDIDGKFNIVIFNSYIEYFKAYIGMMRHDELVAIRDTCYKCYKEVIDNNNYAKLVCYSLTDECYNQAQTLLNIDKTKYCKK